MRRPTNDEGPLSATEAKQLQARGVKYGRHHRRRMTKHYDRMRAQRAPVRFATEDAAR